MKGSAIGPEEDDAIVKLCSKCREDITSITDVRYRTSWELVNEAGSCFRAMSYIATCVMCRAALEATLHEAYAWKKIGDRLYLEPTLKYCRPNLEPLIEWARDTSLIGAAQVKIARKIQREGNFSAHLRQKIDLKFNKYVCKGRAPDQPYRVWMDRQESWSLLNETAELVVMLVKRVFETENEKQ